MCTESWRSGTEEHLRGKLRQKSPRRFKVSDSRRRGFHSSKAGEKKFKWTHSDTRFGFFFLPLCAPVMPVASASSGLCEYFVLKREVRRCVRLHQRPFCSIFSPIFGEACRWLLFVPHVCEFVCVFRGYKWRMLLKCRLEHHSFFWCVCVCVFSNIEGKSKLILNRTFRGEFLSFNSSYAVCWMCGGALWARDSWAFAGRSSVRPRHPYFGVDVLQCVDPQLRLQQLQRKERWRLLTVSLLSRFTVINLEKYDKNVYDERYVKNV